MIDVVNRIQQEKSAVTKHQLLMSGKFDSRLQLDKALERLQLEFWLQVTNSCCFELTHYASSTLKKQRSTKVNGLPVGVNNYKPAMQIRCQVMGYKKSFSYGGERTLDEAIEMASKWVHGQHKQLNAHLQQL